MSGRLTVTNLRKEYADPDEGTIVAVNDLSLDIDSGEMVIVVGPSGCGKSTTLRCIAGLTEPTSGTLRIDDEDVTNSPARKRDVAMVFQDYALYPHMTARENIGFGLKMRTKLSDDEIRGRVDRVAETMGIADLLEKRPDEMSGGQQQRVALGRAIVREPAVFLMDEPLSNLDAKLKVHMRTELQQLQEKLGTTTIYVTHDQHEAMTMSDRIIVLNHGDLQQIGTPDEVYEEPANRFVADFIGSPSMNFFDVTLEGTTLVSPEFEYEIPESMAERIRSERSGKELELGIRPESILIDADDHNSIPATVEVMENGGSDNYLHLSIGDQTCRVRVPGDVKPATGYETEIGFDPADIHIFDVSTGDNLLSDVEQRETVGDPTSH